MSALRCLPRFITQRLSLKSTVGLPTCVVSTARNFANFTQSNTCYAKRTLLMNPFSQHGITDYRRMMSSGNSTTNDVHQRVMSCLTLYDKIDAEALTAESHFMKDFGLDSLDHVEIIVAIENEFSLEIPDDIAETLLTPNEIIKCVIDRMELSES